MRMPAGWWQMVRNRFLRWAGPVSAVLFVVASLAVVVMWRTQHIQLLSVQSSSMTPVLKKGDAVLVRAAAPRDIAAGDIVSYPDVNGLVTTHRVVQVDLASGWLVTKGDANAAPDPATNISHVVGTAHFAAPGLGYVIDALRSWPGLVLGVYLPAAVVLFREFVRVGRHYLKPTYVLRGR